MDKQQEEDLKEIKSILKALGMKCYKAGIIATSIEVDNNKVAFLSLREPPEYCKECGGVKSK